ncbi:MAG: hypothetical protein HZA62_13185 [Rhodocyclales bacterium]|nr:hypothetical protein [Rhodocyclales bacterium]
MGETAVQAMRRSRLIQWRRAVGRGIAGVVDPLRKFAFVPALILGVLAVAACASTRQTEGNPVSVQEDIHERLSEVISRDGFSHRIISDRSDVIHNDSIHLRIPIDGIKRRHEGVERVLISIARVCALQEFVALPIRIVVATIDDDDGKYMRALLDREVGASTNVSVLVTAGSGEGIVIAIRHPPLGLRPR